MTEKTWLDKLKIYVPVLLIAMLVISVGSAAVGSANLNSVLILKMMIYKIPLIGSKLIEPEWSALANTILWDIRIPRIILGGLVGAALAVAGAVFQGLLRNPLADPYTLGVSSGAAVGAVFIIIWGGGLTILGMSLIPFSAIGAALITLLVVYSLAHIGGRVATQTIILSGVVIGSFLSAMLSFMLTLSYSNLEQVIFWLMGSMALKSWDHIVFAIPFIFVGLILAWFFARELNIMALGEESAIQLGVNVDRAKKVLLFTAAMLSAAAVSVSGTIGFVGLIIPHLVRMVAGPDHRVLIPLCALVGAMFLILADTIARTIVAPSELPVGILTAFLGAPFFAYLLRSNKRSITM